MLLRDLIVKLEESLIHGIKYQERTISKDSKNNLGEKISFEMRY